MPDHLYGMRGVQWCRRCSCPRRGAPATLYDQTLDDIENGDNFRIMLCCQFKSLAYMVAVVVGDEDEIAGVDIFVRALRCWVPHEKGINEDCGVVSPYGEIRVTVPGYFHECLLMDCYSPHRL